MRLFLVAPTLMLAALAAVALAPERAAAQGQQPQILPLKPPPAPPIKPYKPVAETPPKPFADPSFDAFRKQLGDLAVKKDRAAIAKLVVAQGFFWVQDKDLADPHKPGIANLAKAIDLDAKDGSGWDTLTGFAAEPTAQDLPDHKGVICAPADPTIDAKAFEALVNDTQTDPSQWGYAVTDGIEVRGAAQPNAPVIEKLGLTLVQVLPDAPAQDNPNAPQFVHVVTPSGKSGFVIAESIAPLGGDEMCYAKDAGGWKITGYFGGVSQ
jgi:hypothetical protein